MPVGATIGAAGLGAVGSIAGGLIQNAGTQAAADTQKQELQQTRADLAPYNTAGQSATNQLMTALPSLAAPITMSEADLEAAPGFKFTLAQGLKSVQNSAAARGLGTSGAALKGAASYATGLADSTYNQQFQNALLSRQNSFNVLSGTAGLGENAAAQTGQFATQTGANIGATQVAGGNALAGGVTGAGNALTTGANTIGGINYTNQLLNGSYGPNGYTPPSTMYRVPLQLGYQAGV